MGTNACLEKFLPGCLKETELRFLTDDMDDTAVDIDGNSDERPLEVNMCIGNKVVHAKTDGVIDPGPGVLYWLKSP